MSPDLKVHPVAALFPMMTDEELDELAADIKANGLRQPITVQKNTLIDGRNRLQACEKAKVKPTFAELDGEDPVAFILSQNVIRRHLSKGQQAMAVAKARLFAANKSTQDQVAKLGGVSQPVIARANVVLEYAPDLADLVLAGAMALDEAYTEARRRKGAAKTSEAKLKELAREASDLHTLVVEERMSLADAEAAVEDRKEREAQRRASHTHLFATCLVQLDDFSRIDVREFLLNTYEARSNDMRRTDPAIFTAPRIREAAKWLVRFADLSEKEKVKL